MKQKLFLLACLLTAGFALVLNAEVLTNSTVYKMVDQGLNKKIILAKIQSADSTAFDVSVEALLSLRDRGIPDDVILAMVYKTDRSVTSERQQPVTEKPGIFYTTYSGEKKIKANSFTGSTMDPDFVTALFGVDVEKFGLTISGNHSENVITDKQPEFIFRFAPGEIRRQNEASEIWCFEASDTPKDFILGKFGSSYNSRKLNHGSVGEYGFGASGPERVDRKGFSFEEIAPYTFKVKVTKPLKNGEYGFVFSQSFKDHTIPSYTVFDFRITDYTRETFDRIQPGMKYSEVAKLMQYQPRHKKKDHRVEWNFPGAGKVYFKQGVVVDKQPE